MARYRVTQERIATLAQGCQLDCGMAIRVGETIVMLAGRGWAHKRDVRVGDDGWVEVPEPAVSMTMGDVPTAVVEAEDDPGVFEVHLYVVYVVPGVVSVRNRHAINEELGGTGMFFLRLHSLDVVGQSHPRAGDNPTTMVFGHLRCRPGSTYDEDQVRDVLTKRIVLRSPGDVRAIIVHRIAVAKELA